jgi:hypothetical protein
LRLDNQVLEAAMSTTTPTTPAFARVAELIREFDTVATEDGQVGDGILTDSEIRATEGDYDRLLGLAVNLPVAAGLDLHNRMTPEARRELVVRSLTAGDGVSAPGVDDLYRTRYPNGDVVFLVGDAWDWDRGLWTRYRRIAKWLSKNGFRVVMNPSASVHDLRAAVQNDRTKVIIWSGTANRQGAIRDAGENAIPANVFNTRVSRNLRQVVFHTPAGRTVTSHYDTPESVEHETHWPRGRISLDELFQYLLSDHWKPRSYGPNEYGDQP